MALFDAFIKIDGITGESRNRPGQIDLESWSWGVSNTGSAAAGGPGQVVAQSFNFTSIIASQSPLLFRACVNGEHHSATVTIIAAGEKHNEMLEIDFSNVLISSYHEGSANSSDGSLPKESVSFNFAKIEMKGFGQDVVFDLSLQKA